MHFKYFVSKFINIPTLVTVSNVYIHVSQLLGLVENKFIRKIKSACLYSDNSCHLT